MELESYFTFINGHAIRIAHTRIGIETVVRDYLEGASPEEIVLRYPTLSLEQVFATITYYLSHQAEIDAYLERITAEQEAAWQEQERNPSEFVRLLRERLMHERLRLQTEQLQPVETGTA